MKKAIEKYNSLSIQVKAAFWFMICSFMQKGIAIITTPIFTRLMTAEEYGQLNVYNSWYGILSIFVTLCLSYGVFSQGIVKFWEDKDVFASSLQGLSVALVAGWVVVYLLFRNYWNGLFRLTTVQMLALLTTCWTSAAFLFWAVEQRTKYQYRSLVILTLAISLVESVLAVILVIHCKEKVTARIMAFVGVEFAAALYCFYSQYSKGMVFFDTHYWKYAVLFNLPLIPHYLSQTVLNNSDRIMIERLVNLEKAGIYAIAYSVSMLMTVFNTALAQTISPWMFNKIKQKRPQEIAPVAYGSLTFIAVVNLFLIAFGPEVIRIFAPPEYYEAIWVIPPVAIGSYCLFMYDYFARFEFYYEKTFGIMIASVFGAALNILLNYIYIQKYGFIAAAYTTMICYLIYVICHYCLMMRICRKNNIYPKIYDEKILLLISLSFIILSFALMATYKFFWLRYTVIGTALVVAAINYRKIYSVAVKFFNLRKAEEN